MDLAALQNITRFRELLRTETDAQKRQTLTRLLEQEEAKLRRGPEGDGGVRQ